MDKAKGQVGRIKMGLVIGLLATLTGCAGLWSGGYYGGVVVSEPGQFLFGGNYDPRPDVYQYSHRGAESRRAVHSGRSHAAAHSGNRGGKRR